MYCLVFAWIFGKIILASSRQHHNVSFHNNYNVICLTYLHASFVALSFIVTGKAKSTQARLSLRSDFFDDFICSGDPIQLSLNLTTLLDCLQLYGTTSDNTSATITYSVSTHIHCKVSQFFMTNVVYYYNYKRVMSQFSRYL